MGAQSNEIIGELPSKAKDFVGKRLTKIYQLEVFYLLMTALMASA